MTTGTKWLRALIAWAEGRPPYSQALREETIAAARAQMDAIGPGCDARGEGIRLERQRIYMALVARLWGCDRDANAVLDIVENPEDGDG